MPVIVESKNPFDPSREYNLHTYPAGRTIAEWVERRKQHEDDFYEYPVLALVNNKPVKQSDWGIYELENEDVVNFRILAGDPVSIFAFIGTYWQAIVTIASLIYSLSIDIPGFDSPDQGDPVYFIKGQQNQTKVGEPIECPFGRNRLFPSYAARPYSKFENNDQFLYQLFCLGQGEYASLVEQIDDTAIANFEEITTEVYAPGDSVTLFPDNVETSSEVSSVELFGPNEPDYPSGGYVGPFTANAAGTVTTILEWDVVFPRGLFEQNSGGGLDSVTVTADFEYREIDDGGAPIGSYTVVSFTKTLATTTIQRFTVSTAVSSGRYEVRAKRTNNASTKTNKIDDVQWFQLRAILPSTKDYGDVTLVAMKARATNNLNSNTRSQYNVTATRMLPIWNGSVWSANTATRNPIWAYCEILRSVYGANLADTKLDLAGLLTIANGYTTDSVNFDWVFDSRTTIWEALKTTLRAGRAAPVINLTQFSAVRDQIRTVPVMAFSTDDMVSGSFRWDIQLQKPDDYDGIQVEYADEDTRKQETVDCLIGSDAGLRMQVLRLPGITNRDKAYQEGLFIRYQQILQREIVTFDTGLEGNIPSFGDYIVASHDVPDWGISGQVVSISGGNTVTLTESTAGIPINSIGFRDKYGEVKGPYVCSKVAGNDYQVLTASTIDETDFVFNDLNEPPVYYIGETNKIYKELLVTAIDRKDDDTASITAVNYDARMYSFDSRTAPPLAAASVPAGIPNLPTVTGLTLSQDIDDPTIVQLNWDIALGAQYYIVEVSTDNTNWSSEAVTTGPALTSSILPGLLYFRVAGVNTAQGPWITESGVMGSNNWVDGFKQSIVTDGGDQLVFV